MKRTVLTLLLPLALGLAACGGSSDSTDSGSSSSSSGGSGSTKLNLVAYSTPEVVYDDLIPDFEKTAAGKGVSISGSYGASGDQSRAVEGGQKADVVTFSTQPDLDRLVKAGIVDQGKGQPISTAKVVFTVRKDNPKGIRAWADLLKPGVEVITPNPFTSGAAKWNLLAAYGTPSDGRGLDYVKRLLTDHVKVQPKSGREALQTFQQGQGDVLLSYDYETTTALKKDPSAKIEAVDPKDTIRIEIVIAPTRTAPKAASDFISYARSAAGQKHFADWGYGAQDGKPGTFTIRDLGGWSKVNDTLFDPDNGSIAKIEASNGVSTEK